MPVRIEDTFRDALAAADRPLAGMWVCSGSPLVAELCAGSGLDWLLVDAEHSPNGLESILAVEAVEDILKVDGVDAVFMGPSDLAASMGLLGQQEHPEVRAAVEHCLSAAKAVGKPAGVNAFNPDTAHHYLAHGAGFILVGADVALLARGSEALAAQYIRPADGDTTASY